MLINVDPPVVDMFTCSLFAFLTITGVRLYLCSFLTKIRLFKIPLVNKTIVASKGASVNLTFFLENLSDISFTMVHNEKFYFQS